MTGALSAAADNKFSENTERIEIGRYGPSGIEMATTG
jgi:hypothetical protein